MLYDILYMYVLSYIILDYIYIYIHVCVPIFISLLNLRTLTEINRNHTIRNVVARHLKALASAMTSPWHPDFHQPCGWNKMPCGV